MEHAVEQQWAANLQRERVKARRALRKETTKNTAQQNKGKEISLIEAGIFAGFLAPIDLLKYLFGFIPMVGWILAAGLWFFGMGLVMLWLLMKGTSLFDILKKNWFSFATTSSGFVIIFALRQRARKFIGVGSMTKKHS